LRSEILIEAGVPGWVADTRGMGEEVPGSTHNMRSILFTLNEMI
jgi:hypothetical protein